MSSEITANWPNFVDIPDPKKYVWNFAKKSEKMFLGFAFIPNEVSVKIVPIFIRFFPTSFAFVIIISRKLYELSYSWTSC